MCLVLALSPAFISQSATAASRTIWQIGTFDEASIEFRKQIDYANPAEDPVYVVGRSDAAKDWPAYQPGSANGLAGYRPHPFTILFDVPEVPRGIYVLKVALLAYTPRVPSLQVDINGHQAWFYQHPQRNSRSGDEQGGGPTYSSDTITLELPTQFLNRGNNKLVLTAVDQPDQRDNAITTPGTLGVSGITYDALELKCDDSASYRSGQIKAEVVPTIFYKSRGDGLVEIVEAYVRFGERPHEGLVTLTLGNFKSTQTFTPARDFGEARVEFEVPEFEANTKGKLGVSINGRS